MVASDGLWDVVGETRAAGLVAKAAEEDPRKSRVVKRARSLRLQPVRPCTCLGVGWPGKP